MSYARINYQNGLPTGSGTTSLWDTTAMGVGATFVPHTGLYYATYTIAATRSGTVKAEWSIDDGATWHECYSQAFVPASPGTAESFTGEIFLEGLRDVRILWVNGGTNQATFDVNLSLTDQRSPVL